MVIQQCGGLLAAAFGCSAPLSGLLGPAYSTYDMPLAEQTMTLDLREVLCMHYCKTALLQAVLPLLLLVCSAPPCRPIHRPVH